MKNVLGVLVICMLSACASQTTQPDADIEDHSINSGEGANVSGNSVGSEEMTFHPLQDPSNILSKRSIYYDYDSYTISPEYRDLVMAHGVYLRENPNAKVMLQGNTDERGSREYNLALGQRRADSVKNMMRLSGARNMQIEAVSLGEEKPRGQGESAWAENRRADIIYEGE